MNKNRLVWSSAGRSHVGMVRTINEDSCLMLPELGLWAVADGMGGHEAGDVASQMIVDALRQVPPAASLQTFLESVRSQLAAVNQRLREESARHYHHRTIGSTVVVLLTHDHHGACLWAGDSRIYRLRQGILQQLTRDHSHVQELVDQGLLKPEDALHHPLSNVITRAVGSREDLELDQIIFPLNVGDMFLLCSDGLNKTMLDEEIAYLLSNSGGEQDAVQAMIHTALMREANDNVTTVIVHIAAAEGFEMPAEDATIANMTFPEWLRPR